MMRFYRREDGTICKAIKFEGAGSKDPNSELNDHAREVIDLLSKADLLPYWTAEEVTDEWQENEAGDDYEQIVIPEHIKLAAGNDELAIGGYVVERDGDVYIQAEEMFEAIWTLTPSDDMDEWVWHMNRRLPYANTVGYWQNKLNPDAISMDGGVTYTLQSERELYRDSGPVYESAKAEGNKVPEGVMIADICKHCGKSVVNFDTDGTVFKGFKHSEGRQRGLIRCWPEDTGQPYGLDATPRSYNV